MLILNNGKQKKGCLQMYHFVRWIDVQNRLDLWRKEHGAPTRFLHALSLLRDEGTVCTCEDPPGLDLTGWDSHDPDSISDLLNTIPVNVDISPAVISDVASTSIPIQPSLNVHPIKIAASQQVYLHQHSNFELLYVLRGEGGIKTQSRTVHCSEGSLCLIAPDFYHDVYAAPGSDVISLALWRSSAKNILHKLLQGENMISKFFYSSLCDKCPGYLKLYLPPDFHTRELLRHIFYEGYSRFSYAKDVCAEYVSLLFYYALRTCSDTPELCLPGSKKDGIPMVSVVQYIQAHYRTVTLSELAGFFHYEPDYLSRQIKFYIGKSFVSLVLQIKLDKARQLLRETDWPISQIADYCGFSSTVHFSQTFRKKTGITPTEYRNQ